MSTNLHKNLPVGVQDFESLIHDGYLYVDKTEQIWRLTHSGRHYFLARPRRFGKSLLLSTIEAYFEGKKELFDGLYIQQQEQDWINHPIFLIGLNLSSKTRRLEDWEIGQKSTGKSTPKSTLKSTRKSILEIITSNPNITLDQVAAQLRKNPRGIDKHIKILREQGLLRRVDGNNGGHWEIIDKD